MGLFLLFDSGARLVRCQESCVDYGVLVPLAVFFADPKAEGLGYHAIELHPAVLRRIRPQAFHALIGHCHFRAGSLHIDDTDTIMRRLHAQRVAAAEQDAFHIAREIGSLEVGRTVYGEGDVPRSVCDHIAARKAALLAAKGALAAERAREPRPLHGVLADLASQVIPVKVGAGGMSPGGTDG